MHLTDTYLPIIIGKPEKVLATPPAEEKSADLSFTTITFHSPIKRPEVEHDHAAQQPVISKLK